MNIVVTYKDGTQERFNATDITADNRNCDIGLAEKMTRPPDRHPLKEAALYMKDIKKIEVFNGKEMGRHDGEKMARAAGVEIA